MTVVTLQWILAEFWLRNNDPPLTLLMNYNVCSSLIRLGLCQMLAYIVVIVVQYIPKAEGFTISVKGLS